MIPSSTQSSRIILCQTGPKIWKKYAYLPFLYIETYVFMTLFCLTVYWIANFEDYFMHRKIHLMLMLQWLLQVDGMLIAILNNFSLHLSVGRRWWRCLFLLSRLHTAFGLCCVGTSNTTFIVSWQFFPGARFLSTNKIYWNESYIYNKFKQPTTKIRAIKASK